ncbi:ribonuclease J [Mycoplasma bovis]|uniref:Ribonuclease J n=1 Tax=Mycoplasmopsis bovis (strain ATCC 25523 / DSM 22781 / NCTC 10131 / PG45) TaxID=289397 RepID=A0A454APN9_MYCBG|nr:ribonuclease J [Mycoplasmopsis bovis]ADR25045.1 metallo-beta-lactamase family protein [Mycoplasmopsis bovis PG45]AXJ68796.1 RNase J family beta-CASP ribonuclease [Mycoplasmopsis bovis]AXJ74468.1 RNase J family beta-CASP ribonuclease [Mycoplasmopsis bovis]MBT1320264.1 ribonuclease J [Mycoplasmopsis bovis]MBT1322925.1 ribonuclease J [Mycoplasmopsis bovis]
MTPTRIIPIGGVQEIGKSTLIIEHNKHIVIIDAGIKFADTATTGIKGIIPDYKYLKERKDNIEGLFITHGHEDHIGGVVYLVKQVHLKRIYAPKIAIQYLKLKFDEHKITHKVEFIEIEKSAVHEFGNGKIKVDFWTAQHSIPDAFGIRVTTPNGSVMCTGDFRFDYNPIGEIYTDFTKLDAIGKEGLTVLLSDSTNAMRPSHSPSENDILIGIERHMRSATRKIIVTAFASNLTRVKAIIDLAVKLKKKVACFGRSMVQGIKIGRKLGNIKAPSSIFVEKRDIAKVPENQLVVLTTGSQGEQLAALSRMSYGKHANIKVEKGDMVIFSSNPIPGNRMVVELLINRLSKLGAIIKENGPDGYLHTSGHAYKHEHDKIFQLTRPKFFIPYHGEYRMCVAHGESAIRNGVDKKNVFIPEIGQVFNMVDNQIIPTNEKIEYGPIYIDGTTTLSISGSTIKERSELSNSGFVNIIMTIDKEKNEIVGRPHLISRGSFYVKTSLALVEEAKRIAHGAVLYRIKNNANWNIVELKQLIIDRLEALFYKEKRRRPIIIPTFLFVKEENDPLFDKVTIKFENKNIDSKKREANQKVLKELQEEIFGSSIEFSEDFRDEVDDE